MKFRDKHTMDCLRGIGEYGPIRGRAHAPRGCDLCEEFLLKHRLAPIAHHVFDGFPAGGAMARAYRSSLGAQIVYQQVFLDIADAFAAHGITALPLKGLYLCEKIYPAPGTRPMSDLDLLVPREQFPEASRVLRKSGFGCDLDFLKERSLPSGTAFRHGASNVIVDLHYSLLNEQGIRGLLINKDQARVINGQALQSAVREPYLDRDVATLSMPFLLVSLLLHHYTHNFSGLLWFLDAIYVCRGMNAADWETFGEVIRAGGLETAAGLWLRLAAVNFDYPENEFLPQGMRELCGAAEKQNPLFALAVRRGRLSPLGALALVPDAARRARAVARVMFPSRTYLEEISHTPIHGPASYLREFIVFQKRLLLR